MPRPGDDAGDRVGDVRGVYRLPELARDALEDLGPGVIFIFGVPDLRPRAFLAPGWADLGSAASRLAVLRNQQPWTLACGNPSRVAFQNPSAPSPMTSTAAHPVVWADLRQERLQPIQI